MKPFKSATLIYFIAFIALGLTRAALGATLPGLAEQTQSTFQQISYLFTAHSMGYLLGAYRGGRLYDRLPGHTLNAAALFGMTFLLVLAPGMKLLWLLVLVFLLLGMVEASLDVGTNTLIVWLHRLNPGPVLNTLHFFYGAGAFLSPI
ncbi:MAG: hypothetical protein U1B80_04200, partial [Anaerolineaceae bacterium]|nr:hypothetical protein [Anaerolineaceae bacterium]